MEPLAVLVIPVLAILDYQLTLAGVALAERRYRKHFRIPQYELNPVMQPVIAARKRVSWRHLLLVALMTGLVYFMGLLYGFEDPFFAFLVAMVLGAYGVVTGRHLANFLLFRYLDRNPQEIAGTVEMSQAYITRMSQYQCASAAFPVATAAILSPTPAVLGVATGVLTIAVAHSVWYRKARKQDALRRGASVTEPAEQRTPPAA